LDRDFHGLGGKDKGFLSFINKKKYNRHLAF